MGAGALGWALGVARPAAGSFALRVWGADARAALRLQRRRERALRPEGDRAVRPRLEPALLRQPAGLHVPAARRLRRVVRRPRRASRDAFATRPDRGLRRRPRRVRGVAGRSPSGCSTSPGARLLRPPRRPARRRAAGASRSCRSSTRTWRSTTSRRSRRSAWRCGAPRASLRGGRVRDYARRRARPRPRVRDEVHGRDRAAAAARRRPAARSLRAGRPRVGRARPGRSPASGARGASSSPTRTRCSTSRAFRDGLDHQTDASPTTRWASSA